MDYPWIKYLNSPELVVKVQTLLGIEYPDKGQAEQGGIRVQNKFLYYLFIIGTELGDENFYACFIPCWFWNVDGAVGRRFVFVWALLMYIGQALKDVLRCPRPPKPVVKLQEKWSAEYGLPSTHAMVAVSIPFSILIYTRDRYQFSFPIGLTICVIWCSVICLSRLYLGMHSVLDVLAGLALSVVFMFPMIPLVDALDGWLLTCNYSPVVVVLVSILLIKLYPQSDKWTPTRGDTTLCVSVCAGIQVGAWINYQLGYVHASVAQPPYQIIWPSHAMLGTLILRTVLGLCCILATKAMGKSVCYAVACAFLGRDKTELIQSENTLANKPKILVDLSSKFVTCFFIGLNIQYLLPNVFKLVGIGRPDFYTEI